jgi:hypothetical protein
LEAFQLLELLQEMPATTAAVPAAPTANEVLVAEPLSATGRSRTKAPFYLVAVASILGFGLLVSLVYLTNLVAPESVAPESAALQRLHQLEQAQLDRVRRLDEQLANFAKQLPKLAQREDLAKLDRRLARLEQPVTASVRAPEQPNTPRTAATPEPVLTSQLTSNDTLWDLAKKYYGKGHFYPVLLALNPGLGIYFAPGAEIRLPASQEAANQLLTQLVIKQDDRYLLRYPIISGDTWQQISRRLNGNSKLASELKRLNGGTPPIPGTTAFIPFQH